MPSRRCRPRLVGIRGESAVRKRSQETPGEGIALSRQKPNDWKSPLRRLRTPSWSAQQPTWLDAKPALIDAALRRATARPAGNWYVLAASRDVGRDRPFGRIVAGIEVVAWRDAAGALHAGPGACPHLGAPLCSAAVQGDHLVCRWHGMALRPAGQPGWRTYPAHDDGVLAWVRLDAVGGEEPLAAPVLGHRPAAAASMSAVTTVVGRCGPDDVIANRLDPWHGSWFHPYSFANLTVLSAPPIDCPEAEDRFLVEVSFRLGGGLGVPVHATFSCPERRTVLMEIVDGEGTGSVVETHATPVRPAAGGSATTAVIEATIVHSDRTMFPRALRAAPAIRPLIAWAARRLWRDDIAYAERRYALRSRS